MGFRREGTYAIVAILVALVVAALLFAVPAWSQQVEGLTITKQADQESVDVGEKLTYEILVRNETDQNQTNLEIRDTLPENVNLVDVRDGRNVNNCPITTDEEVRCTLTTPLPTGERARLFITIEPNEEGEVENVARLRQNNGQNNLQRGSARVTTDVNDGNNNNGNNNDGDLDCSDFDSQEEAQNELEEDEDDPNNLDADNDGIACEQFNFDDDEFNFDDDDDDDRRDRRERRERFRERVNEVLEEEGLIDEDGDGDIDQDDELIDAQEALDGEITDGEITDGEFTDGDDFDDDGPAVSANVEDGVAEASTPNAVARAGDPDELEPITSTPDNVVDEIPTSGPLPNTGGMPLIYWLLPLAGLLILAGLPAYRWAKSRR